MSEGENLPELTIGDILRGLILFKSDKKFLPEELEKAVSKAITTFPELQKDIEDLDLRESIYNLLFFDNDFLHGDWSLPHYQLSREGRVFYQKYLQEEYGQKIIPYLESLAEKVWNKRITA